MSRRSVASVVVLLSAGVTLGQPCPEGEWCQWTVAEGGNGHYYMVVAVPTGIRWDEAQGAAQSIGGHLATAETALENEFLFSLVDSPEFWRDIPVNDASEGPWLGGVQEPGSTEPAGGWMWVTGVPFAYTNWASGQPNNDSTPPGLNQDRLHFLTSPFPNRASTWNDLNGDSEWELLGYIVESEDNPNPVPTLSEWSMIALSLLLVTAGSVVVMRRPQRQAA